MSFAGARTENFDTGIESRSVVSRPWAWWRPLRAKRYGGERLGLNNG